MSQKIPDGASEQSPILTPNDTVFLKDLADIIRSRNIFFLPFFGAFLALLFAKSQYVIEANIVIKVEAVITFFLGLFYAYILSNCLETIDSLRILYGLMLNPRLLASWPSADVPTTLATTQSLSEKLEPNLRWELRSFKWAMYSLWVSAITILCDIFLRPPLLAMIQLMVNRSWPDVGPHGMS